MSEVLLALVNVVATPLIVAGLGSQRYGFLGVVAVLSGQFGIFQLGLGPAATRLIAECRHDDPGRRRGLTAATALLGLASGGVLALLFSLFASRLTGLVAHGRDAAALASSAALPMSLLFALQPLEAALQGVLGGDSRFELLASIKLGNGVAKLLATVVAVELGGDVPAVLWLQATVELATVAGLFAVIGPRACVARRRDLASAARLVLQLGVPLAAAQMLSGILADAEKLVLAAYRSLSDVAHYTAPFNAASRVNVFAAALATVIMPRVASLAMRDGGAAAAQLTRRASRGITAAMTLALSPLIALAPELLRAWVGGEFEAAATLPIRIVLVGIVANTAAYLSHAALLARARPMTLPILYALEAALHVPIVLVCVARWGVVGAALAWTIRVVIDAAAHRLLAGRVLGDRVASALESWAPLGATAMLVVAFTCWPALAWPLRLAASLVVALAVGARMGGLRDWLAQLRAFSAARS